MKKRQRYEEILYDIGGFNCARGLRALEVLSCPDKVLQADLKASGVTELGNPVGDDDRISGMLVEGNVFDHCGSSGFGGVQIHGGQDNMVHVFDRELVNRNYLVGNLVVKTPELIARGQNISSEDNTFIPGDTGHQLGYWISDEVLAGYGIAPVEFGKMGPRE